MSTIIYQNLKKFGAFNGLDEREQDKLVNKFTIIKSGRASKYHNIKVMYSGNKYDSLSEAYYAHLLDQLLANNKITNVERQVHYPLEDMEGRKRLSYRADFVVETNKKERIIIDIKGRLLPESKIKYAYFRHVYKIPIHIVYTTGIHKFTTDFLIK